MPETVVQLDMSPMATRADLLAAMYAVEGFRASLATVRKHWPNGAECPWTSEQLGALSGRLRDRATEFDTRPRPCEDCHTRHTKKEGCFEG
jgi:hypothetical protein